MRKNKLFGFRLYLVRLAFYALALFASVALLSLGLLCLDNPLPFVRPCSLILFFVSALLFGLLASREEGVWFSALPCATLSVLLVIVGLIIRGGKGSVMTFVYAILFVGCFLVGRILPRKKRRKRSF